MIVVLTLSKAPPSLRGYLTRWLLEIDRGTYVGRVGAKVADELWRTVRSNLPDGRATMIRTTDNEQGYSIAGHNQSWQAHDYDGITLLRHPHSDEPAAWRERTGWSNNAKRLRHRTWRKPM